MSAASPQPSPESTWQPATRRDAVRRPLTEGFVRHTRLLRTALIATGALAGLGMVSALWAAAAAADLGTTRAARPQAPADALTLAQQVNTGHAWIETLALLATAAVWLTWEQTLAASARVHPTARRRSPEAHVAGWLTPGHGLIRPVQGIQDLWRGVHVGTDAAGEGRVVRRGDPERDPVVSPLVTVWWSVWVAAVVLWWLAGPVPAALTGWDDGPAYWIVRSLGQGLLMAAGVAAVLVVRRLDPLAPQPSTAPASPPASQPPPQLLAPPPMPAFRPAPAPGPEFPAAPAAAAPHPAFPPPHQGVPVLVPAPAMSHQPARSRPAAWW